MYEEIDLQLGRCLRKRRRLLGLTQQELGALCGVRFQQIQKYETAANKMSAGMIGRLARALDVQVAYFFEGLDPLLAPRRSREKRQTRPADVLREGQPAHAQTRR